MTDPVRLRVATFNIRNIDDRYEERRPFLVEAFAAMNPDIAALQEAVFEGHDQDDMLARSLPNRVYRSLRDVSPYFPGAGTAILAGAGEVQIDETVRLGTNRTAQRALIVLPGLHTLWFVTTHLHHKRAEPGIRTSQIEVLLRWMADAPTADATIITGDFNMAPAEPGYGLMRNAGYRSAFVVANASEPPYTRPSGIIAPDMDSDRTPLVVDYIWVSSNVDVAAAWLAANEPAPQDMTLYPSDHFAVVADVVIRKPADGSEPGGESSPLEALQYRL